MKKEPNNKQPFEIKSNFSPNKIKAIIVEVKNEQISSLDTDIF